MNPQDKVERVLKEIHVTFSKSPTYNGQPDKMIIDRKHFLSLLDRLNNGIYDMMEQYEQTRQSRQNAERAFQRKGNEIIDQASASADDIYAAAVIYTEDAIGKIRGLMDQTNDSMNDMFRQFRKELKEQKDTLKRHESELEAQLADLADTRKYLTIIEEMNRERARESRDLEAERETGNRYARSMLYTAPTQADVKVNETYFEKSGKPAEEPAAESVPAEKPDIKVNANAAYFKWKAEQEGAKNANSPDKTDEREQQISAAQEPGMTEKPEQRGRKLSEENADVRKPEQRGRKLSEEKADVRKSERRGQRTAEGQTDAENVFPKDAEADLPEGTEFPNEEAILQAVLADEQEQWAKQDDAHGSGDREHGGNGAGKVLKNIFFGKD